MYFWNKVYRFVFYSLWIFFSNGLPNYARRGHLNARCPLFFDGGFLRVKVGFKISLITYYLLE